VGTQVDILLHAPSLVSLEDLRTNLAARLAFDESSKERARPASGAQSSALRSLADEVRVALESISQDEGCASAVRATLRRIQAGTLHHRMFLQGCLGVRGLLLEGMDHVVLSATTPLLDVFERGSCSAVSGSAEIASGFSKWFSELWEVSHSADDALVCELEASWANARPTPFDVYVQILHHFLAAKDLEVDGLVWTHPLFELLTDFQRDAVKQAVAILSRHGGCFVADVVGLGKSYIGSAVLKYLERSDGLRAVIVCPAPLVSMWEQYSETWELNARIVSMGDLTQGSSMASAFRLETNEFRGRELVLIDESHQFRNSGTQRYDLMQAFLSSGRRVILLTATPLNRSSWDVYHQIKLFHQQDRTRLPITPPALREFFETVEDGKAQLQDLLAHLLVRRTRRDILRGYGRDWETGERIDPAIVDEYTSGRRRAYFELNGRRQSFPQRRLETVSYVLESQSAGLYERVRVIVAPPEGAARVGLVYARYARQRYALPEFREGGASVRGSSRGLAGLMRILLFKRLESSVEAFLSTVERMLSANELLLARIDYHSKGGMGAGTRGSAGPTAEEQERELLEELERLVPLSHLDLEAFGRDIRSDCEHLRNLARLVAPLQPERNAKLRALRALFDSDSLRNSKVLIFTQFQDTARVLEDQIHQWFPSDEVEASMGASSRRTELTVRFAPKANAVLRPRFPGREIRILVATDVLSEGVNLQDCNVVINYDLHWNPVRLIQRFGRVDRIGSAHDMIHAFNFLPELEIEKNLGLQERLSQRIREIHQVIGEDAAILDPAEQINERSMYAIYGGQTLSDEELSGIDEGSAVSEGAALLAELQEQQPELYADIASRPLALRAARNSDGSTEGVLVLLVAGQERRFVWCPRGERPRGIQPQPAISMARCPQDEAGLEIPSWAGEYIDLAREGFWQELLEREGDRRLRTRLRVGQREVVDRLRSLEESAGEDARAHITALIEHLTDDLGDALIGALRVLAQRALPDSGFVAELGRLVVAHNLHRRSVRLDGDGLPPHVSVAASVVFVFTE